METSTLGDALNRALRTLSALPKNTVEALSAPERAFMLEVLPAAPELASLRAQLAQSLAAELQNPWIAGGDLHDVFAALTALWHYDQAMVSGEHLAQAIQRLIASEAAIGGPYYSAGKLAIAANAQISLFMQVVAKPLPNVDAFLSHVIAERQFEPTVMNTPSLLYVLTKASGGNLVLVHYVAEQWRSTAWQTPLHQAISLLILGDQLSPLETAEVVAKLSQAQQPAGLWLNKPDSDQQLATSALVAAALNRLYQNQVQSASNDLERRQNIIRQAGHHLFEVYDEPLRSIALAFLDQVCIADKNFEVTLLPQLFAQALDPQQPLTAAQSTMLGLAGLCGWMAYTIYDDFLDAEGDPAKLPVACVAMRTSIECFREALPNNSSFQEYVAKTFAAMDEANAWEVAYCRFSLADEQLYIGKLPDYGNADVLAKRSFPHVLGPMAVLAIRSQKSTLSQAHAVESAFRHYLIARQLNDDLQDWPDDIQAGQASFVATAILRDLGGTPGTYYLTKLLPLMQ
ncbi:MAG TPA: hypothetical protein VNG90_04890, partial [Candidatus Acidoferrum sp.]|nr:hypothetical protein [Candidatus Acidoferrum sp.]